MGTRALLVGIEHYKEPRNNLDGVANDVEAISRVLKRFGILPTETVIMRDEAATCENIKAALHDLVGDASENDVRIFYFSGHGVEVPAAVTGTVGYEALVPYDGSYSNLLMDQWMASFLKDEASKCSFWGIYDACHSGNVYKEFGEQNKTIRFDQLEDDSASHTPAFSDLQPVLSTKQLVLDGTITRAVHIAAVSVSQKAIVRELEGTRRSVFTWALEKIITSEIAVNDLERLVDQKQKSIDAGLDAYIAASPGNDQKMLFSVLS